MHIDLNSAFAMSEQQANPLLRGKPVGVTNRLNDHAICITASYEAKRQGIGIGTRWREARWRAPNFVMLESDPDKYQHIYRQLRRILESYSPTAYMKSVDEGIIDFTGLQRLLKGRRLEDIAGEIKQRIRSEIGDYMTVNIGIAQNRWLAKVAAGFHKPDGLLTIAPGSQEALLEAMALTDLPYIKRKLKLRLNQAAIYTSGELYRAPYWVLFRQVFGGVMGHHWYLRLRGYETDVQPGIRTIGRNYVVEHRTPDRAEFALLLHKASVKIGRRLHGKGLAARGLSLNLRHAPSDRAEPYRYGPRWHNSHLWATPTRRADQLYQRALELFEPSPTGQAITHFDLTSYGLEPLRSQQPSLFQDEHVRRERLQDALDTINDRFGELTVQPASVAMSKNPMKDKVPFGTVRWFD
jgi:DNA polymerase-4